MATTFTNERIYTLKNNILFGECDVELKLTSYSSSEYEF